MSADGDVPLGHLRRRELDGGTKSVPRVHRGALEFDGDVRSIEGVQDRGGHPPEATERPDLDSAFDPLDPPDRRGKKVVKSRHEHQPLVIGSAEKAGGAQPSPDGASQISALAAFGRPARVEEDPCVGSALESGPGPGSLEESVRSHWATEREESLDESNLGS